MDSIVIRGAKTHNLKNINLTIPRDQLIVITGLSGSGKSSLAFDTLYAEGQRRYVESLSTYARQFLSVMEKPDVELIEGLSPAISIEQKSSSHNPRSTVGTITEIYDYLRLLYARTGTPYCPDHQKPLKAQTISQIVDAILNLEKEEKIMLIAPIISDRKGEHTEILDELKRKGFIRLRVNGEIKELTYSFLLDKNKKNTVEVVVDRLKVKNEHRQRLAESVEMAISLSKGLIITHLMDEEKDLIFSTQHACPICHYSIPMLEPKLFSFNSPHGACPDCDGLGMSRYIDPEKVIVSPSLSIESGALYTWNKQHKFYYQLLISLSDHYKFSLTTPWSTLEPDIQNIILNGSKKRIPLHYANLKGRMITRIKSFEGIVNNLQRRYDETESESIKEELGRLITFSKCPTCQGSRLNKSARCVKVSSATIAQTTELSIDEAQHHFTQLDLSGPQAEIATPILNEILNRLQFLQSVGLNYLSLGRQAETLSGGEMQRIRLASQIGSGLVGVMYILDEPSIGLHQRDNQRLIDTLVKLKNMGNTVIVVEHDEDTMLQADHIIDIGPYAGVHGGNVIAQGPAATIKKCKDSLTGQYLNKKLNIPVPQKRLQLPDSKFITLEKVSTHNLNEVTVEFPIGLFTCVTGVSGSGKSSLVNDTLYPAALNKLSRGHRVQKGEFEAINGLDNFDKVIDIDQSPIGRTPRSNPATYTGLFTPIRELFAGTQESRSRGYTPGRFSFNVAGGRCDACRGDGVITVEMHFLSDVYVTCDQCNGKRYNRETLTVKYKGKTIAEVLSMTIEEAQKFFSAIPSISRKLNTLEAVGLGYLQLGQSATTLSGGEAQRIKLSRELSKRALGQTLYILDEPTTGLHFHDVKQLLSVLINLRDHGHTIIVIEHHLDVIKSADWVIDLGPEGGSGGGNIIACGTPETIAKAKKSHTGRFLKPLL
jgi:excinuclease ABC subunit A